MSSKQTCPVYFQEALKSKKQPRVKCNYKVTVSPFSFPRMTKIHSFFFSISHWKLKIYDPVFGAGEDDKIVRCEKHDFTDPKLFTDACCWDLVFQMCPYLRELITLGQRKLQRKCSCNVNCAQEAVNYISQVCQVLFSYYTLLGPVSDSGGG